MSGEMPSTGNSLPPAKLRLGKFPWPSILCPSLCPTKGSLSEVGFGFSRPIVALFLSLEEEEPEGREKVNTVLIEFVELKKSNANKIG